MRSIEHATTRGPGRRTGAHRTRPLCVLLIALVSPLLAHGVALGQTVAGTVLDATTAGPLPGAFVVLLDAEGERVRGVLSGRDGGFTIRARTGGSYRLLVELIGYASATTPPFTLEAGAGLRRDFRMTVQAVSLETIEVRGTGRCERRPGDGAETARLWEEARKALEVASWGEREGIFELLVVERTRELDAGSLRVLREEERPRRGFFRGGVFRSIPAEQLRRGGYVQEAEDGNMLFYAPDAEVLLSDGFLETHCFRVAAAARDRPGLIGLAFEPVPERELPDVAGVLWLDRSTAELRRLEYAYTSLPLPDGDWSGLGGQLTFERLPTGAWIVRDWYIRMPVSVRMSDGAMELVRLLEQGGEVRDVRQAGRPRDGSR